MLNERRFSTCARLLCFVLLMNVVGLNICEQVWSIEIWKCSKEKKTFAQYIYIYGIYTFVNAQRLCRCVGNCVHSVLSPGKSCPVEAECGQSSAVIYRHCRALFCLFMPTKQKIQQMAVACVSSQACLGGTRKWKNCTVIGVHCVADSKISKS